MPQHSPTMLLLIPFAAGMHLMTLAATPLPPPPAPSVSIANGVHLPYVSIGGAFTNPSNYSAFLALGGRAIDTALTYGDTTQQHVADAVRTSGVVRHDIFITTKVQSTAHREPSVQHVQRRHLHWMVTLQLC